MSLVRPLRGLCLVLVLALAAACSDDAEERDDGASEDETEEQEEGGAEMRTTDSGLQIIEVTDPDTGLLLEIQDDNVYVKLPEDPSAEIEALSGNGLAGACQVGDDAPFEMPALFPVYWRAQSGDWGTAVARGLPVPEEGGPTLAEHVVECDFFAAPDGSDEVRGTPENLVATIRVR